MALSPRQSAIATVGLFDCGLDYDPEYLLTDVSADERQRYSALRRSQRARQYLASRWLLRQHLAWQLELKPGDVPLQFSGQGPPMIAGISFHLGLSHSHALCLCISSRRARVGCDVERQRPPRHDVREVATQYFHPMEAAQLNATPMSQRSADFYRLWTLKEAALKALGRGIAHGLRTPSFSLRPTFACLQAPDRAPWCFAARELPRASGQYSLALAIRDLSGHFTVYRYQPGESAKARQSQDAPWDIARIPAGG